LVNVALRIKFLELLKHLFRGLVVRMDDAELSRTLNQICLRLANGGKSLIEIGWH
jgi:hypothetical protein